MGVLRRYPTYVEFRGKSNVTAGTRAAPAGPTGSHALELTARDDMAVSNRELRDALAEEVLQQVMAMSPAFFEDLVVRLMVRLGYGGTDLRAERIGRSGDGGIDGVIDEDQLGLDSIYLQAKRWTNNVGRPEIQGFVGSLVGQRANKGVFITTSAFTADAKTYVQSITQSVVLIDGQRLSELMIDVGLGVTPEQTYVISRIDSDFFREL